VSDVALRMEHVYKKFRKGETYNSLRDLVPAITGRMFRGELDEKDKREFWALQDLSFEVKHGEALGIIGNNGAGKSTALKILSRIMKPTKGRMVVNGRLSALIEVSAGFHQDLTGRENIFLNGTILGMKKREIESKLDQIIAFSGLEDFIDTPVKRYSSGMYARLGFSIAAHVDPEVMIVDEVLSVGDVVFQQRCMERMRTIIEGGTTVLFVSHNLKSVTELCDRTVLLEHGKTVTIGPTESVVRSYLSDSLRPPGGRDKQWVYISEVKVRDAAGEQCQFESGQTAYVDVEVRARDTIERLAVVIWLEDESHYELFNTSTEHLGERPFSLNERKSYRCTFELKLNVAHGTFNLCAAVHRYDYDRTYDKWSPAATLFVGSTVGVRGAVNCFPKLVSAEVAPWAPRPDLDSVTSEDLTPR
jgi:ABC-type polysaccharide/polyol phosphate transport system ATPase subunit